MTTRGDRTGIMIGVFFVRHRKTGEIAFVELGARYNQQEWELLAPIIYDKDPFD